MPGPCEHGWNTRLGCWHAGMQAVRSLHLKIPMILYELMIHRLESFSDSLCLRYLFSRIFEGFFHVWFLNLCNIPNPQISNWTPKTRQAALLVFINSLNHGYQSGYLYNKSQRSSLVGSPGVVRHGDEHLSQQVD